jgi:hypothetical protein
MALWSFGKQRRTAGLLAALFGMRKYSAIVIFK